MERPSIETREEVMFFDTDCGGVVHNLAYLRMIETARTRLATEAMGMNLRQMAEEKLFPVLLSTEASYKRPGTLGDGLLVRGRLASLERVRFWTEFELLRQLDEQVLVTCRQSLALVRMPEGRPQRLPQEWTERWGGGG
ncbi:MAG: thioesterase family protein [Verrucomicrobiota bacterium]